MENKFIKKCPKCDGVQTYTTKNRLECSITINELIIK